ncbi:MAG: diadenylate cyclase CdaA [Anaerolineae bacterium]
MTNLLWMFSRFNLLSLIDILLVAVSIFFVLYLIRGTQAVQLLRGVILLVFVAILVTNFFQLTAFSWLIKNSIPALLVAIPVIFQPELRRALERLGRAGFLINRVQPEAMAVKVINHISRAARILSEKQHGALIVLERETGLQEYADTGIELNSDVSSELLATIFYPNTALHDGAVIVREDQVAAAACILPVSERVLSDRHLGLRHRAAVGVTEQSDAISIVVSEETGIISIAHNGRMVRHLDETRLRKILRAFYLPRPAFERRLPRWLKRAA